VRDPAELEPYQFYRGIPSRRESLLPALAASVFASVAFAAIAVGTLLGLYFLVRGHFLAIVPLTLGCLITPLMVPAGVSGVVTAIRFLRLPPDWRSPPKVSAR
jgi:hypothetical protein